ncbi:MAG TPA: hypothetical protein VFS21_20240, partial [Roseiflexaceae bacterium]|nr:hypothetical protein [Roseiflexaceae bacterium]
AVITDHLFDRDSWDLIHAAAFCAAARQMIRTLLPVVVRWLRDDSAGDKPNPANRWELRIAQTQLQSARRALEQHNHVLALHLARWAQFEVERLAAAHDEHEAVSNPDNGGETSLL